MKQPNTKSKPATNKSKSKLTSTLTNLINQIQLSAVIILLLAMPFHAMVVIIIGNLVGHQLLIAAWKELVIMGLIVMAVFWSYLNKNYKWLTNPINIAVLAAVGFGLFASIINWKFNIAWLAGIKTTILPLLLFLSVQPIAYRFDDWQLEKLVLIPAVIVSMIAIWQFLVIPTTWLSSIGYSAKTIIPFQTVTAEFNVARAFSTLGGPNQLGVYLILPAIWLFIRSIKASSRSSRIASALGFCLVTLGITVSFSRSAIIGLIIGLGVATLLLVPNQLRKWLAVAYVLVGLIGWLSIQSIVTTGPASALKGFLFRGDLTSLGVIGSDQGHIGSVANGLDLVRQHPLGLGLGSAGPASFYGPIEQHLITENWYIQIALELGIFGLGCLLLAYFKLIVRLLAKSSIINLALVAGLIGLFATNLFLHSYTDSTVSIIVYSLTGLVMARRVVA